VNLKIEKFESGKSTTATFKYGTFECGKFTTAKFKPGKKR
jgi:hypothetical protein